MHELIDAIKKLKADWLSPKDAMHAGKSVAVPLVCRFEPPAKTVDIELAKSTGGAPEELLTFWQCANGASLFEDEVYGQWGLRLWPVLRSLEETRIFSSNRLQDYKEGDLIVGEFLGDSELLLVRCDPAAADYGSVVVALPLDERVEWDFVSPSFQQFFVSYSKMHGQKFWQRPQS